MNLKIFTLAEQFPIVVKLPRTPYVFTASLQVRVVVTPDPVGGYQKGSKLIIGKNFRIIRLSLFYPRLTTK